MVRFDHVAVEHSTASTSAEALHQGVFVCGTRPLWLLAHRGGYRVHMMDNLEPVEVGAAAGAPAAAPVAVAAMASWNQGKARNTFVMVTAERSELRFCRMPKNVRPHREAMKASSRLYRWPRKPGKTGARQRSCTPKYPCKTLMTFHILTLHLLTLLSPCSCG